MYVSMSGNYMSVTTHELFVLFRSLVHNSPFHIPYLGYSPIIESPRVFVFQFELFCCCYYCGLLNCGATMTNRRIVKSTYRQSDICCQYCCHCCCWLCGFSAVVLLDWLCDFTISYLLWCCVVDFPNARPQWQQQDQKHGQQQQQNTITTRATCCSSRGNSQVELVSCRIVIIQPFVVADRCCRLVK